VGERSEQISVTGSELEALTVSRVTDPDDNAGVAAIFCIDGPAANLAMTPSVLGVLDSNVDETADFFSCDGSERGGGEGMVVRMEEFED
jgi:hypothetical protein